MDLADEIAYLCHDTDDGLKAQMLTLDDAMESRLFRHASAAAHQAHPGIDSRLGCYQTVLRMIDARATDA